VSSIESILELWEVRSAMLHTDGSVSLSQKRDGRKSFRFQSTSIED
jgi:hypothetical protein